MFGEFRASTLIDLKISNAKIYEVSEWIRNISFRVKKIENHFNLQKKWLFLAQDSLLSSKASAMSESKHFYDKAADRLKMRNKWRFLAFSLVSSKRISVIKLCAQKLRELIRKIRRKQWQYLVGKLANEKSLDHFRNKVQRYKKLHKKWEDMILKAMRQAKIKDFEEAKKELMQQRANKNKNKKYHTREDWLSLIKRIKFQNMFKQSQKLDEMKKNEDFNSDFLDSDDFHSNIKTQTNWNEDTPNYKNFKKIVSNYVLQNFYKDLKKIYEDFLVKQEQKKIRRQKAAKLNWKRLVNRSKKKGRLEEFANSYEDLCIYRDNWKLFYQHVHLKNLKKLCINGLRMLDARYLRISTKMKDMIIRTIINHKKKIIAEQLQQYREKQMLKAADFGTQFITQSIGRIDKIVQTHYQFKQSHYKKTKPRKLWNEASNFAYSFTNKCLLSSLNLAIPLLTRKSTPLAEAFAKCQTVLTQADDNPPHISASRQAWLKERQKKNQNVHIIIGFGYNDRVSLLD